MEKLKNKSANLNTKFSNPLIRKFCTQTILITACALCLGIVAKELSFHSRTMCKARRIHIYIHGPAWIHIRVLCARSPPICTYVCIYGVFSFKWQRLALWLMAQESIAHNAERASDMCGGTNSKTCCCSVFVPISTVHSWASENPPLCESAHCNESELYLYVSFYDVFIAHAFCWFNSGIVCVALSFAFTPVI